MPESRLIIGVFGGWARLQGLLAGLARIAARHSCDIAAVATLAVLERPAVGAAIVGATNAAHLASHDRLGHVELDAGGRAAIAAVSAHRRGPLGDVYELERDRTGRHGRIMKYNLSK